MSKRQQGQPQVGRHPGGAAGAQRLEQTRLLLRGIPADLTGHQVPVEGMQRPRVETSVDVRADLHAEVSCHCAPVNPENAPAGRRMIGRDREAAGAWFAGAATGAR